MKKKLIFGRLIKRNDLFLHCGKSNESKGLTFIKGKNEKHFFVWLHS